MPPDDEATPAPPAPAPAPPADEAAATHEAVHDSITGALDELRDRIDDVEALAHSAVMMQLDDDEAEPEPKTTIEPRDDAPAAAEEKPTEEPPAKKSERHSGLFA